MRLAPLLAMLLLLAVVVAGCASGGKKDNGTQELGEDVEVEVTDTTGGIRGVVVDDAIRPLDKVHLVLRLGGAADRHLNTTSTGTFSFSGLAAGTYFLEATRDGYATQQTSAEVVAGQEDPPVTRIQLIRDLAQRAYYETQQFTGFIVCTTSLVAVCGAPNVVSNVLLCPVFGICQGNLTDDKYGWDMWYQPNATWIQTEVAWDSTQALSTELSFQMETIGCEDQEASYENSVGGNSPLTNFANETEIRDARIDTVCSIFHSLFSGGAAGTPLGFTLQQRFEAYSTAFYGYSPPDGWTLIGTGSFPPPPT